MTKIVETAHIGRDPDTVWREIGAFSAIGNWRPMLAKVESNGGYQGSVRRAEGKDGSRQVERLLETV